MGEIVEFWFVVSQIVAISVPIALGWCLHKLGVLDDQFDAGLSRLVLNVALPCSIVASIDGNANLPGAGTLVGLMAATAVVYIVGLAVAFALTAFTRAPRGEAPSYRFAIAFGNCGFVGLPVISAILGNEALLYVAISLIPANIAMFGIGPALFSQGADEGNNGAGSLAARSAPSPARRLRTMLASLKTPTFFASLLVLVLALLGITDLGVAGDSIGIIGQAATPLALLVTGSSIARYRPLEMVGNTRAYVTAAGRLLIVPALSFAALLLFPLEPFLRAVIVLDNAMPVATAGVLFCLQAGGDAKPMAQATFLSVVGSVLTIPAVTMLVGAS